MNRLLLHGLQNETQPRQARHGTRDEGYEVAFLHPGIVDGGLQDGLVFLVALELLAVPGLGDGVVLDVGFVGGAEFLD